MMAVMRKLLAWLGMATLMLLLPSAPTHAAGATVLKPYIVLIMDVSNSMNQPTGSGPPTCPDANGNALPDTKLNHARCAVQNIVNSYGDIVFAFARYHENASNTGTGRCGTNASSPTNCALAQEACNSNSDRFQLMTALVDGANASTALWADYSCSTCTPHFPPLAGEDPEVWNAGGATPIEGSLAGAKCYWMGQNAKQGHCSVTTTQACECTLAGSCTQSCSQLSPSGQTCVFDETCTPSGSGGVSLWSSGSPGFSPIVNDPSNAQFLPTGCDSSPTCTTNCCATQCRPYIVIVLSDGDESCGGTSGHCSAHPSTLCDCTTGCANACPAGDTCQFTAGTCSGSASSCYLDTDCPSGQTCLSAPSVEAAAARLLHTTVSSSSYRVQTVPIGFGTTSVPYGPIENLALAGGATSIPGQNAGFYASDEAGIELAMSQIIAGSARTEKCNGLDDDCDGAIDEDFPLKGTACSNGLQGVCRGTGTYVCTTDGTGVQCDITSPGGTAQTSCPSGATCNSDGTEVCGDNLDNDCDGFVDEGCTTCTPVAEICNGKDDDCDRVIDEDVPPKPCAAFPGAACSPNAGCCGVQLCAGPSACPGPNCGNYGACNNTWTPVAEVCNNIDDDCDGIVDENLSQSCSNILGNGCTTAPCPGSNNPGVGVCHPGTQTCSNGSYGTCVGEVGPSPEICNGLDDDCDGIVDEDTGGGSCTASCGVGTIVCATPPSCCQPGTCMAGQHQCGTLYCSATTSGTDATCNNIDDDCDGKVDEEWQCGDYHCATDNVKCSGPTDTSCAGGQACVATPAQSCTCTASNTCNGMNKCEAGQIVCQGTPIDPTSCCDCSGQPQQGMCSGGSTCVAGLCKCEFPCAGGEFPCPAGKKCVGTNPGYCEDDPCYGVNCPSTGTQCPMGPDCQAQTCTEDASGNAQCVATCSVMSCPSGLVCNPPTGQCAANDCTTFPALCTSTQNCIVDPNTGMGVCMQNLCAGVTCPDTQYCEAGACIDSCATKTCPAGQRCRLGACEQDPCGMQCPSGQVCDDATGHCIDDPCQFRNCPQGQWCNPNDGMCEIDPCVGTSCPANPPGQVCRGGTCYAPAAGNGDDTHVTVAGGGCSTTGGSGGLWLALGLLLLRRRGGRS